MYRVQPPAARSYLYHACTQCNDTVRQHQPTRRTVMLCAIAGATDTTVCWRRRSTPQCRGTRYSRNSVAVHFLNPSKHLQNSVAKTKKGEDADKRSHWRRGPRPWFPVLQEISEEKETKKVWREGASRRSLPLA